MSRYLIAIAIYISISSWVLVAVGLLGWWMFLLLEKGPEWPLAAVICGLAASILTVTMGLLSGARWARAIAGLGCLAWTVESLLEFRSYGGADSFLLLALAMFISAAHAFVMLGASKDWAERVSHARTPGMA